MSDELRRGLARDALAKVGVKAANDTKVAAVQAGIDSDCAKLPDAMLFKVAGRRAFEQK